MATINAFDKGDCTLWIYCRDDEDIFTNEDSTTYHKSYEDAMAIAEKRFGVKGLRPVGSIKYPRS